MVNSPSETTALLSHSEQDYDSTSSITPSDDENTPKTFRTAHRVTILIIVIVFLNVCGDMIMESPMTRICESVICYQYFETADPSKIKLDRAHIGPGAIGGVDEMFCKADQVQDKLAELNGMMQLFDSVATLVLAVPFGWTADRFGRWPLVFFNLLQFALRAVWNQFITWNWQVFDVRSIWFASALSVMGGGSAVISALLYVVVADITSETDRTAAFLRIGATIMSANLLMPPLSAWLMQKDPWIPALVGTALMMAATPLSFCIPETLGYAKLHNAASTTPTKATQSSREHPPPFKLNITKLNPFTRLLQKAQSTTLFLLRNWRIPILILPFTTHYLIGTINRLLLQYTSKRYTLTLSTSVLILAIRNAATVLLLLIILPYLSTCLTQKYRFTELKKDLYLARASQIICTVGWLGLPLSPNIFSATVSLVGTAFVTCAQLLLRSILASCVPEGKIAEVYSFISVVDTVGTIAGAPALAKMFQEGLRLGEVWIGLPFGVLGVVSGLFAGLLFMVGCGDGMSGGGDRDGDGDEGEGVEE